MNNIKYKFSLVHNGNFMEKLYISKNNFDTYNETEQVVGKKCKDMFGNIKITTFQNVAQYTLRERLMSKKYLENI